MNNLGVILFQYIKQILISDNTGLGLKLMERHSCLMIMIIKL